MPPYLSANLDFSQEPNLLALANELALIGQVYGGRFSLKGNRNLGIS